jgi:hypothetical protein
MINFKLIPRLLISAGLIMTLVTGCGAQDKEGAREAADNFLKAVQENNQEGLNYYAPGSVATGDFAAIINADEFRQSFLEDAGGSTLSDENKVRVEEFSNKLTNMVQSYEIKEVSINQDKSASVIASVTTSFSLRATKSEAFQNKLSNAINQYREDNYDSILEYTASQGEEAAASMIYNNLVPIILDMYEAEYNATGPESYAIVLTLQKNADTGNWYVTNIQDLESSVSGTATPATDTTTTDASSPDTDEVINAASTEETTP